MDRLPGARPRFPRPSPGADLRSPDLGPIDPRLPHRVGDGATDAGLPRYEREGAVTPKREDHQGRSLPERRAQGESPLW